MTRERYPKSSPWINLQEAVESDPPALDFVLPGFKSGTVGALVSPGGSGKSFLGLQIAAQVAGGPDLLGWGEIPRGRAVFLSAEDDTEILTRRLHVLGRLWSPGDREAVYEMLSVASLYGHGPDLAHPEWQASLRRVADDARLVVLDTLRRFHQLDENDGGAMGGILAFLESVCRETGASILFLHHLSKAGALHHAEAQQASRGSSVLVDNIRWQANLVTMGEAEAKKYGIPKDRRRHFVRLTFPKLNYGPPIPDIWLRRVEGGVLLRAVEMVERGGGRHDI